MEIYGNKLESDGSWTCNDGCITQRPEAYTWTWIDNNTLVVSYDGMFEDITFYLID